MDMTQFALASATLIGIVNGIKLALDKNWRGFAFFMISVIGGTFFGLLHWYNVPSIEIGFSFGVAASGVFEVSQRVGGH